MRRHVNEQNSSQAWNTRRGHIQSESQGRSTHLAGAVDPRAPFGDGIVGLAERRQVVPLLDGDRVVDGRQPAVHLVYLEQHARLALLVPVSVALRHP